MNQAAASFGRSAQRHVTPLARARSGLFPGLVLLASLFPYVKFGPIGLPSEVQAWAALLGWLGLIIFALQGRLVLNRFHATILGFSLLFMIYVPFNELIDVGQYLRKSISFILSASILIIAQYIVPKQTLRLVKLAALTWLAFALLGQFAPDLYPGIVNKFVPGALGAFGVRGVTSLAPEATDFGFTMVYLWLLAILASIAAQARGQNGAPWWLYAVILLNIALSRSGAGIMALAGLLLVYQLTVERGTGRHRVSGRSLLIGAASFGILTISLMLMPQTGVRGLDLLSMAIQSPSELIHTTLSYRIVHNLVGLYGMMDTYFLGHGAGTFTVVGPEIYLSSNIADILGLQGWYLTNMVNTLQTSPLAIFPVIFFEYGIFGMVFVGYIFACVLRSNQPAKYVVAALLFMTWAQSFPAAYPLFWLVLGLHRNKFFSWP